MLKRGLDIAGSIFGLTIAAPVLFLSGLAVWLQDFRSPLYVAKRVGQDGRLFGMVKLRSMVVDADRTGVTSTSTDDNRITKVGRLIRRLKLDEVTQLWNVLRGEMSFVGPRPNVMQGGVALYTEDELRLLSVRPGITDYASIVFSDEGVLLAGSDDPDLLYNQLIRPWKSRLSLFYIDHRSIWVDLKLVLITLLSAFSRRQALRLVARDLRARGAPRKLVDVASRADQLEPAPPPGSQRIVASLN